MHKPCWFAQDFPRHINVSKSLKASFLTIKVKALTVYEDFRKKAEYPVELTSVSASYGCLVASRMAIVFNVLS